MSNAGILFVYVPVSRGKDVALVSRDDHEEICKHKWHIQKGGAVCYAARLDENRKRIFMHAQIIGKQPVGLVIDHANGNGLDNRRENLRAATKSQNAANSKKRSLLSKYKGVCKNGPGWQATICHKGKNIYLGTYKTQEQAAIAYDLFAYMAHGEFAVLNTQNI